MGDGEYRSLRSLIGVFGGDVACLSVNERTARYVKVKKVAGVPL